MAEHQWKKLNDNRDGESRKVVAMDNQEEEEESKKQRVIWTPDLERKFLEAVDELGSGAVPSKIQMLMNVDKLGRKQISSHLQKYRLRKKRAKEEALFLNSSTGTRFSAQPQLLIKESESQVVDQAHSPITQNDIPCPVHHRLHVMEVDRMLNLGELVRKEKLIFEANVAANNQIQGGGIEMGTDVYTSTYDARRHHDLYNELYDALISDAPADVTAENNQTVGGASRNVMGSMQLETGTSHSNAMVASQTGVGTGASTREDRRREYYNLYDAGSFRTAAGEGDFINTWDDYDELTGELLSKGK